MSGGKKTTTTSFLSTIPESSRKTVISLKEIVNCPEHEIYAALQDCNMDPNEAVNRLLTLDPFHEVKKKREKKKENKDTTESRQRSTNFTSNRGGRGGTDRYVGRSGTAQLNYSESGTSYMKPAYKKENGVHAHMNSSYSASVMGANNVQWQPSASVSKEHKLPTIESGDGISLPSKPTGFQSAWVGAPGQVSMADIVKMGRPQNKASSTVDSSHRRASHVTESPSIPSQDQSSKDEWPLIETPVAIVPSVIPERFDSNTYADPSPLHHDRSYQNHKSQVDEIEVAEDSALEKYDAVHVETAASASSRIVQDQISGGSSHFNEDIYNNDNMSSYQSHQHDAFKHQEAEDGGAAISSVAANLQQLCVQKDEQERAPSGEDNRSLVIPNHLQIQSADCSHLSFGSFGPSISAAGNLSGSVTSEPLTSEVEEPSTAPDTSSVGHFDTRNTEYYGEQHLRTNSDGNLNHRNSSNDETYGSPSPSQADVLKQEISETGTGNQYHFPSPISSYNFESNEQFNGYAQSQTSSQMQNLAQFSSAYTNPLPSTLLASTVQQPMRESDLSYSPFPTTQTMPANYGNTVTSISGTISVPEQASQTLPSANAATGPTLPQHLAVHPYSQPTLPPGQYPNMISYPFLPQNYTYMPSAFQRAFGGNNSYHQSLAAVLPQYKNSVSVSSLPQSGAVPPGYGAFGSSANIPGNFTLNPQAAPSGSTIGYDDVINSQYKDVNQLLSLQQNENSAMWLQGAGARSMAGIPANTYYNIQGQNQQPAGFRQGQQPSQQFGALGYPNYYHSQAGISMEHQQQIPRDVSVSSVQGQQLKQSQHLWPNNY